MLLRIVHSQLLIRFTFGAATLNASVARIAYFHSTNTTIFTTRSQTIETRKDGIIHNLEMRKTTKKRRFCFVWITLFHGYGNFTGILDFYSVSFSSHCSTERTRQNSQLDDHERDEAANFVFSFRFSLLRIFFRMLIVYFFRVFGAIRQVKHTSYSLRVLRRLQQATTTTAFNTLLYASFNYYPIAKHESTDETIRPFRSIA